MTDVTIRQASVRDADTVGKMVGALLRELFPESYSITDIPKFQAGSRRMISAGKIWAFLAWNGDDVVGVLTLHECHAIYAEGAFGEISELYVSPEYRSRKVGEDLISTAVEFARGRNWHSLEVGAPDIPRWQRSVDFYKSQGFSEGGPRLDLPL